ncbi:hypothetical protein F5Y11DRAFT_46610 [Daldinia sp. FL1419]|nr:hypothetical protein F5Y11DRAFT_46610 [Daldinia sp. FL1419]
MTPISRKRKAELGAVEQEALEQTQFQSEQPSQETPSKRLKLTDSSGEANLPPLHPHRLRRLRRNSVHYYRPIAERKRPLPVVFFTVPEANPRHQTTAKGRSSNNVDMIMVVKSLFEHADKYGVAALPTKEAFETWLEENKDTFIQNRQATQAQPSQDSLRAATHPGGFPEMPATQDDPTARHHPRQPQAVPITSQTTIRRVIRTARHSAAYLLSRAATILEGTETELGTHREGQQAHHQPGPIGAMASRGEDDIVEEKDANAVGVKTEPTWTRPVAPPLDRRFFHPNGELHSVYKYLTAQIPLPRQWVRWAIDNGINEVPERGDIREPGVYVAEDTFNYGGLFEAVHRGCFKTYIRTIDYYVEHWPMVRGCRDIETKTLTLHRLPAQPPSLQRVESNIQRIQESIVPSPQP